MRSLSPLSRRILKKAGIAAAFFCSAFLFGSVLSHFTCRALRKAAPVFLSAAPETPVSSVSMPVLSSAAENWGLSFPEKGKTPVAMLHPKSLPPTTPGLPLHRKKTSSI